jgi:hypothetical protein
MVIVIMAMVICRELGIALHHAQDPGLEQRHSRIDSEQGIDGRCGGDELGEGKIGHEEELQQAMAGIMAMDSLYI